MRCKVLTVVAAVLISSGLGFLVLSFDGDWSRIGATAVVLGGQAAVTAYFAGKRGNLDDAFQWGYQAGFYDGERVKPKVIRLPTGQRREPSSRR